MQIKITRGRGWYKNLEGTICDVVYFRNAQKCYMVKDPSSSSYDSQSGMLSYIMPEDCIIIEVGEIPIRNMWLEE